MEDKIKVLDEYIQALKDGKDIEIPLHESDIADILSELKKKDNKKVKDYLTYLPAEVLGDTILELPEKYQDDISKELSVDRLADVVNELDTDDATDLVQIIEDVDEKKAKEVINQLEEDQKEYVKSLKKYEEDQAGSVMQVELFSANINEKISNAIQRLKKLKEEDEVENIHYVFIVDDENKLIGYISLEDLIVMDFDKTFFEVKEKIENAITVTSSDDVQDVANVVEKYNLTVVPVVDNFNHLLGRITPDDIYDIIEESATEQMYSLANVDAEEELEDSVMETGKSRATWLLINLITALIASFVIGLFSDTIDKVVALAVLMPIVASMGGIAGTQTMTVVVRQIALGEIELDNAKDMLKKEILIALLNGVLFSCITAILAFIWFKMPLLGVVMALAIFINLLFAGLFGAGIPLLLKKFDIDPAIASGVLLTTITDVVGFFSFLGLAKYLIL